LCRRYSPGIAFRFHQWNQRYMESIAGRQPEFRCVYIYSNGRSVCRNNHIYRYGQSEYYTHIYIRYIAELLCRCSGTFLTRFFHQWNYRYMEPVIR
jgi:hypothetical protein